MDDRDRIITAEIERLKRAWQNAQDRYAYSGSRSTERTMHNYQVLWVALEDLLARYEEERIEKKK